LYIEKLELDKENICHDSYQYLLQILQLEIGIIDHAIARIDDMTKTHRNWAVIIWAGAIGIALGQPDLRKFIIFTAIIPLLFWIVHMRWLHSFLKFVYRENRISEFLNSEDFVKSFKQRSLKNFKVLDPTGIQHTEEVEYKKYVNMRRVFKFTEIRIFYFGIFSISIIVGIYFMFI